MADGEYVASYTSSLQKHDQWLSVQAHRVVEANQSKFV